MAVRVAGARGRDRNGRIDGVEERVGRGRLASVVRDLEQVDMPHPIKQLRVHLLLDVTRQEEAATRNRAQQHDRHVVDPRAGIGWLARHLARDWPEDLERDVIDGQPITGGKERVRGLAARELRRPRRVAGSRPEYPGLEGPCYPVTFEEQRETGD